MTVDTEAGAPSRPCVSYPDEQLFPFCFYTRLLHSQGANSTVPPAAAAGNTRISTLIQAQHPRVDEGEMEKRLAERLRARTAAESARLKRLRDAAPSKIVSSFCDPKVEKQQALLHSELTAFLLEVRQKNIASLRLRHQLQHSRAVHERLNAGHTFSDPSSWVG
ncbi:hypothetical protein JKF63_01443 [Porcisia hertigi]|uniref:Uncharacterized protein n=1 Tax=Porcisia hertigi TaxID=2761500 RepID=A0A836L9Z7_9TRYP|nr:hypothetical protein JKF63_01443 [Porcisia hertigi]